VFSPEGNHVAVKVNIGEKYAVVMDDRLWKQEFDALWNPVFSPGGDKILLRAVKDGKYIRYVIHTDELLP
jgi:hypothetical protein